MERGKEEDKSRQEKMKKEKIMSTGRDGPGRKLIALYRGHFRFVSAL